MIVRRALRAFALAAVLVPAGAASAAAATVSLSWEVTSQGSCGRVPCAEPFVNGIATLLVAGAPTAESLTLSVAGEPRSFRLADAGGITAGPGCEADGPERVRCTPPDRSNDGIRADWSLRLQGALGAGDDRFTLLGEDLADTRLLAGGEGDDRIDLTAWLDSVAEGGPGNDTVIARTASGGDGDDLVRRLVFPDTSDSSSLLSGGAGDDVLLGDSGGDTLIPGPGTDVVDGGGGYDTVDDSAQTEPLRIDLTGTPSPIGGGGVDTDEIRDVEKALGGSGDDYIVGNAANNELLAGPGRDTIYGGGGSDTLDLGEGEGSLFGEEGDDTLRGSAADQGFTGGPGADFIELGTGPSGTDYVTAGSGDDTIVGADVTSNVFCAGGRDTLRAFEGPVAVGRDCELIAPFGSGAMPLPVRVPGGVRFALADVCEDGSASPCKVSQRIPRIARRFAASVSDDRLVTAVRRVAPRVLRRLRSRPVPVLITATAAGGEPRSARVRVDLR